MIRKLLAALILLVILMITPVLSLGYATLDSYLNPSFYTDEEVVESIYDAFLSYVVVTMDSNLKQETGQDIIDEEQIKTAFKETVKSEDLVNMVQETVDQFQQEEFPETLTIDTTFIKETLPTIYTELFTGYFNNLPACTAEQESSMASEEETLNECMPSDFSMDELTARMEEAFSPEAFAEIPDQAEIDLTTMDSTRKQILTLFLKYNPILKAIIIGIYLFLVGLLALSVFKPAKSVVTWVGNAFFWAGLPLAVINPLIKGALNMAADNLLATQGIGTDLAAQTAQLVSTAIGYITTNIMWQGIILSIIGITMFILGAFIMKEKK